MSEQCRDELVVEGDLRVDSPGGRRDVESGTIECLQLYALSHQSSWH